MKAIGLYYTTIGRRNTLFMVPSFIFENGFKNQYCGFSKIPRRQTNTSLKYIVMSPKSNDNLRYCGTTHKIRVKEKYQIYANKALHGHLELYTKIILIQDSMGFSYSCPYRKWCQIQLKYFVAVQLFCGRCVRTQILSSLWPKPASPQYHSTVNMSSRGVSKEPHVQNTISLLQSAPTLSVPQEMCAAIQYGHHFFTFVDIF